ncbi:MAG: YjbF family lipoprotein [Marinovum sp.]|nr:YjbF family lipoprotein [Marinovum sp.]
MSLTRILACAVLVLSVAACGNTSGQNAGLNQARAAISGLFAKAPPRPNLRAQVTPEALAATQTGLIYLDLPSFNADSFLTPIGRNKSVHTWGTADGTQVSLDRGIITATKGLATDLVSAGLAEVRAAVRGQRSRATRVHRYYNGENQIILRAFVCDYGRTSGVAGENLAGRFTATRVVETCSAGGGGTFQNTYFLDSRGTVRTSTQWVSPQAGYAEIQLLKEQ